MMNSVSIQIFKNRFACFTLGAFEQKLCILDYRSRKGRVKAEDRIARALNARFIDQDEPVLQLAREQLTEYFAGSRTGFNIPLHMAGTDFQKRVWKALTEISYAETLTYTMLAKKISNEKAVRAVAGACAANVLSLVVPCHRVIGKDDIMTGYVGGVMRKKQLLMLEKNGC